MKDKKWSIDDLKQTIWTENQDKYYLGKEKNEQGESINCNGIRINTRNRYVYITTFDGESFPTGPCIEIYKKSFLIYE